MAAVYGADGKLDSRFLFTTKTVLGDIAEVADEIGRDYPLNLVRTIGAGGTPAKDINSTRTKWRRMLSLEGF